ncbi:MAG: dTDP-4-dehydrorhamnose reductase [Hyphomicrobiaceae bacterium]
MRLLIAGWQGQVARAIAERAPGRSDISACALGRPALNICEVRTIERALSENRPDVIINTAGYTAVDEAEDNPERAFAFNRDGARLLAQVAARRDVPIIHLSTVNIFDGAKAAPYVESDAPAPLSVYGRSKLEGESAVRVANPRHVILRTSWVFSPFADNFLMTMLAKARAGHQLRVVADQFGSPTYAPDLADAIFDVAARVQSECRGNESHLWGTCHIANAGGPASWYDLAVAISDAAHPPTDPTRITRITSADYPTRARRPKNSALDTARIGKSLGITLRDWRAAVADAIARL